MDMFYDLMIIGRLFLSPQSGMCFYFNRPLPVSRINWQILLSEQSKQPAEAAQFKACSEELGWHSCAALLSQSRWVGAWVWARMHVSMWLLMCVFSQSQGVMEQIAWGDPDRPSAANQSQQRNSGAPCIHLPFSWWSRRSPKPFSILSTE